MYHAKTIANYFIKKSIDEGKEITPMKVLKLVYIAHGWYLALAEKPLINQQVEAWRYGPVVRDVYDTFKLYGNGDIDALSLDNSMDQKRYNELISDSETIEFLDKVWDVYKKYNGMQLSELTHKVGTPWYQIWTTSGQNLRNSEIIPNDLIKKHYMQKAN